MTEDYTESNETSERPTCCGGPEERTNSTGDSTSNRRRFLLGVGAATALVAGCVGGDGDSGDDDGTSNGDDDGTSSGDSSNGDDDGTSSGDDGTDSSESSNGDDDGTSSGDDGTDSSESSNGDDDGTDSGDGGNGDDDGTDSGDGGRSTSEQFFEDFKWEREFRAEFTDQENGLSGVMRFHDGDIYYSFDGGEGRGELYLLEEGVYSVQNGDCVILSEDQVSAPEDPSGIDQAEDLEAQDPDITEVGTDTIDGDPVTVYEVDGEAFYTMYVLDSGYVRRVETEEGTADYYNWGDTEPIEPPDMDCTSPGGGGNGDGGYP